MGQAGKGLRVRGMGQVDGQEPGERVPTRDPAPKDFGTVRTKPPNMGH